MTNDMKFLLQYILAAIARLYVQRHRPMIIAITGSAGKTSTKEAVSAVVRGLGVPVRASKGNLNNELGIPLTILGDWADEYYQSGGGVLFWLRVLAVGVGRLIVPVQYPKTLILEYGADRPGDIRKLVRWYRPHIAVVTCVGEIPVHVEYFSDPDHVAREKSELVRHLDSTGFAVLNYDDPKVLEMRQVTHGRVLTFGMGEGADLRSSKTETIADDSGRIAGAAFKLHHDGNLVPIRVYGSLGDSQAYAASAAAAVGVALGMNLVRISEALAHYHGPAGRLRILQGIKNTIIIDDTYNASPAAMHLALDVLRQIVALRNAQGKTTRALVVLGDMLELGKYTVGAHQAAGNQAGDIADVLVCVGEKAKFIADSAANQLAPSAAEGMQKSIFTFHISDEAKGKVQELLQEGDVVLIKGSQGVRMEKIVKEIMAEPERAGELLVRQSEAWLR